MPSLFESRIQMFCTPAVLRASVLPAPVLLAVALLLSVNAPGASVESFRLMAVNTFVGYALLNTASAALLAVSFMEYRRPGRIMMGCGALIWSCSGFVLAFNFTGENVDVNRLITMHNSCLWLSSLCHLAGVTISPKWQLSARHPARVVAAAYLLATALSVLVVFASFSGSLPTFFVPGYGGSLVRHFVLSSTVGMLSLTGLILLFINRAASHNYLHWYAHALILLAVGVTAVCLQKVNGGWIGWIGRGTQSLGALYLLIASLLSRNDSLADGVPLWQALSETREKWIFSTAVAGVVVSAGATARLLFLPFLGPRYPFATFYPAVLLAAAYGGFGPGLAATGFSLAALFWIRETMGSAFDHDPFLVMRTVYFAVIGIGMSWGCREIRQLQKRAVAAETEAAYACERALAAERLRETTAKLQQSERAFATFVNTADEGVWIVDAYGITGYINKRLAEMLGRETGEILGRRAHEFIHAGDLPHFNKQLDALQAGSVASYDLRVTRPDGMVTWLHVSSAPLLDEENGIHGSVAMCTDITRKKRVEEELNHLNLHLESLVLERSAELLRLNRELESFCHSISHELRAPVARLEAFSGLVREAVAKGDTGELPFISERIEVAGRQMRVVIDCLLAINRLSRADMRMEDVDLSQLAGSIASDYLEEARGRKVQLQIEPHLVVSGDRAMLNICLRNLFENAFKYSRNEEAVSIQFGMERGTGAYYLRDRGAGFDMNFSERLFEPFSRLHHDREFEGTGMGLAIVKRIIERHGGKVWAEGKPGEGATVRFTLDRGNGGNWYGSKGGRDEQPVAVAG